MSKYTRVMAMARRRVAAMDRTDGGSQAELFSLGMALRTVLSAIECGINTGDWRTVGEAQVMLQQIEQKHGGRPDPSNVYPPESQP